VLIRRKDASGITHGNPPNRNGGFLRNDGFQVYDCIDADLRPFANNGEVEYPCACGQEDLVFDGAAEERGVGPMSTALPTSTGYLAVERITALSRTMTCSPSVMG
jgi:hypothetical protein